MNQQYTKARRIFQQFKNGLEIEKEVLGELPTSIKSLIEDYNITYRENRFIVGGAIEEFIAAAMRRVGPNRRDAHSFHN